MVKNTVVMYYRFIQKHTIEINDTYGAVANTQRAIIIKSFGKVKIQCTHMVGVVEINYADFDIFEIN